MPLALALVAGALASVNPFGFPLLPPFLSFNVGSEEDACRVLRRVRTKVCSSGFSSRLASSAYSRSWVRSLMASRSSRCYSLGRFRYRGAHGARAAGRTQRSQRLSELSQAHLCPTKKTSVDDGVVRRRICGVLARMHPSCFRGSGRTVAGDSQCDEGRDRLRRVCLQDGDDPDRSFARSCARPRRLGCRVNWFMRQAAFSSDPTVTAWSD
jgi:hypothetical protein